MMNVVHTVDAIPLVTLARILYVHAMSSFVQLGVCPPALLTHALIARATRTIDHGLDALGPINHATFVVVVETQRLSHFVDTRLSSNSTIMSN